jgi:starch phosphorylase
MLRGLWPQIEPADNPIGHLTNGVHVLTFLAPEWYDIFDRFLGADWQQRITDREYWERVNRIPDAMFWSVREYLKSQMLHLVRQRVHTQLVRNRGSESHLDRLFRFADPANPNVCTVGFGRRFATYKRSTLLFKELDTLREIVCNPDRPVLFIFAGKAHPDDQPGQDLIREIMRVAKMPQFVGHLLLVEGYDLRLARRLVAGVDVWLNNPIHPMEASGTSGMKAAMNGAINLSVLDGWWDEGYDGANGWAIKPASDRIDQTARDADESHTLYEILQDHMLPLYYSRNGLTHSPGWVRMAKRAMTTVLPRFNAERMLSEYVSKFYVPAAQRGRRYIAANCAAASEVARWKERVHTAWPQVSIQRAGTPVHRIAFGDRIRIEAAVHLNGLSTDDVVVEVVLERVYGEANDSVRRVALVPEAERQPDGTMRYAVDLAPDLCGRLDYRIRVYPTHPLLTHPFELGLMIWV